jgi:WhiB family redox-sensing transcriptional regulator
LNKNYDFMQEGKCRGYPPETFFPIDGLGVLAAQRICATCVVVQDCLKYAVDNNIDYGVWGGMGERERRNYSRALRRSRRLDETG